MAMPDRREGSLLSDQRGIALPLSLIVLALLTSLTLAFLALSSTEPTIAVNLQRGESALAFAEAGVERAIWALSNPTVDTAGVNTKLNNLNAIPAAYSGGTLFQLTAPGGAGPAGAYTVAITVAAPCPAGAQCITSHGYVMRNGVAPPPLLANLAQPDIAAQRVVTLQVTASGPGNHVGGPGTPNNVTVPGALTVAGTVQMSGNSLVDGNDRAAGTPNGCSASAGVTIRDKTTLSNGTVVNNSISTGGSASTVGTPAQQTLTTDQFQPFMFTAAQLAALKALAQASGTYIQPTSSAQFNLTVVNGLMFVDTVNGQTLGTPPDPNMLASVKITGASNSGWLIVMGSIRIDGNVTYDGLVYAHNDLSYKGTGTGGIHGAVVTGNVVDSVATVVDTDTSGNSKIYYDCNAIANGGGAFNQSVLDGLNRVLVTINKGTWREQSN
jgi:hypothetical protein